MRALLLLVSITAVLSFAACDPDPESSSDDVVPPQVVALSPEPGDPNVWAYAPITMTFSEQVKRPADRTVVLALRGGGSIDTTVWRSADRKTLTIVPDSAPPASSEVSVGFRAPITDLAGNAAHVPAWSWTVPQWHRTAPVLETGGDGSTTVQLAAGPDGSIYVVNEFSFGRLTIYSLDVHRFASGVWTRLGDPGPSLRLVGSPIVVGMDGAPIVATRSQDELRVYRHDGAAWQPLGAPLATGGSAGLLVADSVKMVLDANDRPVVAWLVAQEGTSETIAVARWEGTAWQPLGETWGSRGGMFDLAAAPDGSISLARTDGARIAIERFAGATSPQSSPVPQSVRELALAVDEDGTEVVACVDGTGAVHVFRWAGTGMISAFRELGDSPSSAGRRVAIRSRQTGRPGTRLVLSFLEDDGPRVLGWDGEEWVSMSREIATPTGQLYTDANIGSWTLAVSPEEELVYAWAEESETRGYVLDLHVVRYNE
jgi:hypothetical protein